MAQSHPWGGAVVGALTGITALAAGELVAALAPGARSPMAGLGRALIDFTPGPAIDVGVAVIGEADKPLMAAALTGTMALAGSAGGLLASSHPTSGAVVATAPSLVGAAYGRRMTDGNPTGTLAAAVAVAVLVPAMQARITRRGPAAGAAVLTSAAAFSARRRRHRRDSLARSAVQVPAALRRLPAPALGSAPEVPGLAPLLTPAADLYKVDVTFSAPRVDPRRWRLEIRGDVRTPVSLSLDMLLAADPVEVDALLACVHNPVGGHRMGNGRWTVVPLAALLERAGLPDDLAADPGNGVLLARSGDGFTVELPLDVALAHAMVAIGLEGEVLPFSNGFPARLLVPGRYGYAGNVKWLAGLEVGRRSPAGTSGYWTSRGWPADGGRMGPGSRIDVPRAGARLAAGPVTVAGYAWAPPEGVTAVEVSMNQGPWRAAQLAEELSPLSWRAWTYTWDARPGAHVLRVRCRGVDGDQAEHDAAPYPHGPAGIHTVPVRVLADGHVGHLRHAVETVAGLRHVAAGRLRLAVASGRAWR